MRVFDIGAHIGLYTLGAATRVGSAGRVYAFEPSPDTDRILRRHVNLNGCQDRVEIVNAVVSDVVGVVPFYVHGLTMSASLGRENVDELSPEKHDTPALKIEVPSLTLDQFCKDRKIRPDMLKIDVEGAELLVLRGAGGLLRGKPPIILCEIHPQEMRNCGSSLPQLLEFLDGLGYCATPLDAPNALGIFHSFITRRSAELRP